MTEILNELLYLSNNEQLALSKFLDKLDREYRSTVIQIVLYGSGARGDRGEDSDLDLLVITNSEDWRDHEPIRYLAASLSNQYDIFLSPKVMGIKHFQRLKREQPLFYQSIRQDGVELFRSGKRRGLAKVSRVLFAETGTV